MINSKNDIKTSFSVLNNGLCKGCGTCVALCPENAIKMILDTKKHIFIPKINLKNCMNCGICFKVCSILEVNLEELNTGTPEGEINGLIGSYINCYTGYAKNYEIRYNSSSGGLVTQFLIFALEKGMIDGAMVTRMKKDNPMEPESFIARTKKEIIESSTSKYCPVPANMALKEILDAPSNEKFAVVGLPCHIQGIKNAEKINKKLKNKILFHLGLFCHHGTNFIGTNFFIKGMNVDKTRIRHLYYRGEGWPGNFRVILTDNQVKKDLDFFILPSLYFFTPKSCFRCNDALSELADISFGDAWLPEIQEKDDVGTSIVISRNKKSDRLLQILDEECEIKLKPIKSFEVIESQRSALYFKKKNLKARKGISNRLGIPFLSENTYLLEPTISDYLFVILIYIHNFLSSIKFIQVILNLMPQIFIKGYHYIFYKFINSRKLLKFKEL